MTRRGAPSNAVLQAAIQNSVEQQLMLANERLVGIEGEIPEVFSEMTIPYECTVCLGKVMLEHAVVVELDNIVGCPYCYEMRLVDDNDEYGPR